MAKKTTSNPKGAGRSKLKDRSKLKEQVSFCIEKYHIKRHGGKVAVVEKIKQFLEDDGN